jgi:hypothetical protein
VEIQKTKASYLIIFFCLICFFLLIVLTYIKVLAPHGSQLFVKSDFFTFYTGSQIFTHGNPKLIYDLSVQTDWQNQIASPLKTDLAPFRYPPFILLILAPLSFLTLQQAYFIWLGLNLILLSIFCYLTLKTIPLKGLEIKILVIAAIVGFFPLIETLIDGQFALFICISLLLSFNLHQKKMNFLSGLVLAILFIKPYLILMPLLFFIFQKNWKAFFGISLGITILTVVSFPIAGIDWPIKYLGLLRDITTPQTLINFGEEREFTFFNIFFTIFRIQDLRLITYLYILISLMLLPLLLLIWRKRYPERSVKTSLQWCALVSSIILLSPHGYYNDLSYIVLIIIFALSNQSSFRNPLYKLLILFYIAEFNTPYAGYFKAGVVLILLLQVLFLLAITLYLQGNFKFKSWFATANVLKKKLPL